MQPIKLEEANCILSKYPFLNSLSFKDVNLDMVKIKQIEEGKTAILIAIFTYKEKLDNSFEMHLDEFFKKFSPVDGVVPDFSECFDNLDHS